MTRMFAALIGIGITVTSVAGAANTVWEQAKAQSNGLTGMVTAIAENEGEVLYRISHDGITETFRVCSDFAAGDALNVVENNRRELLRDAFNYQHKVRIVHNGPYQRCLTDVEVFRDEKSASTSAVKAASAKTQL